MRRTAKRSITAVLLLLVVTWFGEDAAANGEARRVPTQFDADRVYVIARTVRGVVTLYTDTGGGMLLTEGTARRLGVVMRPIEPRSAERVSNWPTVLDASIPAPTTATKLAIVPRFSEAPGLPDQGDGLLGEAWFGGRIWTWNYSAHRLTVEPPSWKPRSDARQLTVGFKKRADGAHENNFPRIVVDIDGAHVPVLLDTGAETYLTPAALQRLHGGQRMRATSMISASVFSRWHKAHPAWRIIDDAQIPTHAAMIEVPNVIIAGISSGPVWFTWRSDASYHGFMSSFTSARVEGSLGGNALRRFVMTIDYTKDTAWFTPIARR